MTNQILQHVNARVRSLINEARSTSAISHHATVGAVREQQLRDFLGSLLPPPLALTSGFISDPVGLQTPQLDLIVYDPTRIPPIALTADVSVVPSDSALAIAEVKSTLTTETIDQVLKQLSSIKRLAHSGKSIEDSALVIVPQVIVAFESVVAAETVDTWFERCPNLVLVSVLSSVTLAKTGETQRTVTRGSEDNDYMNIRAFVVHFFQLIHEVARLRQTVSPRIAAYLMPEWRSGNG